MATRTTRKKTAAALPLRHRVRRGNAQDATRMRQELLAAASALFAQGGVAAVTVRAVAARVGVSPMTPYRYFTDKAELLTGLWESVIRALCDSMAAAMALHTGARERLRASLDAFLAYWEQHPDHYRLVYLSESTTAGRESARLTQVPAYEQVLALGRSSVVDFAAEIGADTRQAKLVGDIRLAMLLGYLQAALVNRRYPWSDAKELRAAYIEQIMATVERGLLHGPHPADDASDAVVRRRAGTGRPVTRAGRSAP